MYTCATGLYRLPSRIEIDRNGISFFMQIDSLIDSRALRSKADTVEIIRALIHGGPDFSNFTSSKIFVFSFFFSKILRVLVWTNATDSDNHVL